MYADVHIPITEAGNILVDEVLTSCYSVIDHDIAQLAMAPMKWFSEAMQIVFGWDDGTPAFVKITKNLKPWLFNMN